MKKLTAYLLALLLLASLIPAASADFGSFSVAALSGWDSEMLSKPEYDPTGERYPFTGKSGDTREHTVMLYLCGSDLESGGMSRGGSATNDLKEIINSEYDQDSVTVLVMAGGSKKWFNKAVEKNDTGIYEVVDSTLVKRNSNGIMNMDQVGTLSYFVNYGYSNYPAKEYSLILWDHGGGPLGSLLHDDLSGKSMPSVLKVCEALDQTPAAQSKLFLLGFDACLEASVEIAKLISPYAKQMVASEESEPGQGWNYRFLKGLEKDASPVETGAKIVDTFFEQYSEREDDKITLSSIDLTRVDKLMAKSAEFFTELNKQADSLGFVKLASARAKLEPVNMSSPKLDLVDLEETVNAFKQYAPAQAEALLKEIEATICSERHNKGVSSGLSVYFPYNDYRKFAKTGTSKYAILAYDEGYTSFINSFNLLQCEPRTTDWSFEDAGRRDTRTSFTLFLTPEQEQNLASASLVILWKQESNNGNDYVCVKPDGKAEAINGQLFGDYVHSALYAVSDDGELLNTRPLVWERDADGHYLVNCRFLSGDASIDAQLVCSLDGDTLKVLSVFALDELGDYYSSRSELDFDSIGTVVFTVPAYRVTTDETGLMRGVFDWEKADEVSYSFDFHGDWSLKMVQDTIPPSELYAAFVLTDYYLDTHTSSLVPVVPASSADKSFVLTYDDDHIVLSDTVSANNGDVYISFAVNNPNEQEIFVHIDQVQINGAPIESDLWIEGNGEYDGIPSQEAASDTLILPGMAATGLSSLQTISMRISVVDAKTGEEIAAVPGTGYLRLDR